MNKHGEQAASKTAPARAAAGLPVPRVRIAASARMRELDRRTIEELGLPALVLMERAALGVVEVLRRVRPGLWTSGAPAAVLAGTGNNGGDGLAIARLLYECGKDVEVALYGADTSRTAENAQQLAMVRTLGVPTYQVEDVDLAARLQGHDLLVDALFGVGLKRDLDGELVVLIEHLNSRQDALVVAVDVPSGLDSDRGSVRGAALRADITVTLGLPKPGLLTDLTCDLVGELWLADFGLPRAYARELAGGLLDEDLARRLLPPRRQRGDHKGKFGTLLALAGSRDMTGAARLMAGAALRSGLGLLRVATPRSAHALVAGAYPEALTAPLPENEDGVVVPEAMEVLKPLFARATGMVIGPGMGRSPELASFITAIMSAFDKPILLDADGLSNLTDPGQTLAWRASADTVITPHPGEMARLLGLTAGQVQQDRLGTALRMARESGTVVVLKGARTIVADPEGTYWINTSGNPRIATGGSGDVLAGLIGGFLAQGLGARQSALLGTYLHGLAADQAAQRCAGWSVMPTELLAHLPHAIAVLQQEAPPPTHSPIRLL